MNTYYVIQFKGDSGRWLTLDEYEGDHYSTLEEAQEALKEYGDSPVPHRIAEAYFTVHYRPVK